MCGSAHSIAYPVLVSAGCSMSSCAGYAIICLLNLKILATLFRLIDFATLFRLIDFATFENDEFMTKVN